MTGGGAPSRGAGSRSQRRPLSLGPFGPRPLPAFAGRGEDLSRRQAPRRRQLREFEGGYPIPSPRPSYLARPLQVRSDPLAPRSGERVRQRGPATLRVPSPVEPAARRPLPFGARRRFSPISLAAKQGEERAGRLVGRARS